MQTAGSRLLNKKVFETKSHSHNLTVHTNNYEYTLRANSSINNRKAVHIHKYQCTCMYMNECQLDNVVNLDRQYTYNLAFKDL